MKRTGIGIMSLLVCAVVGIAAVFCPAQAAGTEATGAKHAYLSASRTCDVSVRYGLLPAQVYSISIATNGWFVAEDGGWRLLKSGTTCATFSVPLVEGYTNAWKTLENDNIQFGCATPSNTTALLSSCATLAIDDAMLERIPCLRMGTASTSRTALYAVYTPIAYSVQYALNSGDWAGDEAVHPTSATYDKAFTVSNPVRTGHSFGGWKCGETVYTNFTDSGTVLSNLTTKSGETVNLSARWNVNDYELKLQVGEGVSKIHYCTNYVKGAKNIWLETEKTTDANVAFGKSWAAWAEPKAHYEIASPYADSANPKVAEMSSVEGDACKPTASKISYSIKDVTPEPAAGGATSKSDGPYYFDSDVKLTANPNTGWHFAGWSDGSTDNPHVIRPVCNTNFVAHFAKNVYKVTFVYTDSDGNQIAEAQSVEYGDSAVEPTREKCNVNPGYSFSSWDDLNGWRAVTGEMVVRANYVRNKCTLRYEGNGKTSGTMISQTFEYGSEVQLAKCLYERTGYVFAGWTTDPLGKGSSLVDEQRIDTLGKAADGTPFATGTQVSLYAQWTPISYTIAFDGNGTEGKMDSVTVSYDEEYELPASGFKSAQSLVCWQGSDGRSYYPGEKVSRLASAAGETITMTAQWTEVGYVEFNAGDGEGKSYRQSFEKNVDKALLPNVFTRVGYTFAGWATNGAVAFTDQQVVANPCAVGETRSLTAVWQPIAYEVTFDANGGTVAPAAITNTYGHATNVVYDVLDCGARYEAGYTFVGWDTNKNARADAVLYPTNKFEVTVGSWGSTVVSNCVTLAGGMTTIPNDHIRLYAIWKMEVGEWSEALGCDNLVFGPEQPGSWQISSGETDGNYIKYIYGDSDDYAMQSDITVGGVLSFEWRAEAGSGTEWKLRVQVPGGKIDGDSDELTCTCKYDESEPWIPVECKISDLTEKTSLSFRPYKGDMRPCSIRNVSWIPDTVQPSTHTVVFDVLGGDGKGAGVRVGGGELVQLVEEGRRPLLPTVVGTNGWDFVGWVDSAGQGVSGDGVVSKGTTNYACYAHHAYRLIYENLEGGDSTKDAVNPNPTEFTFTNAFAFADLQAFGGGTASGFRGWTPSALPAGTTSNFVVRANWDASSTKTYRVTVVTGADGSVTNTCEVAEHKNVPLPDPNPGDGWVFVKWDGLTDDICGDTTVIAQYAAVKYPIVYKNTKGVTNGNPLNYDISQEVTLDPLIPEPGASYDEFAGWEPTNVIVRGSTGEKTFTAKWVYKKHTIAYSGLEGASNADNPSTFTKEDEIVFVPPGSREGYDFVGWNPAGIAMGTDSNVTTRAIWSQKTNTVVIGGVEQKVAYGEKVTLSTKASDVQGLTNVVCVGWVGSGDVPSSGTGNVVTFTVRGDSTLQWLYATNYWVEAKAVCPGEGGGSVVLYDDAYAVGANPAWYREGTGLTAVATPKAGSLFRGWCDAEESSASTNFVVTSPVALTAVFGLPNLEVSVTGSGTVSGTKSGATKAGAKVSVRATARAGSVFAGWYAGDGAENEGRGALSLSPTYAFVMPAADVSLEARFIEKGDDEAAISFELPGEMTNGVTKVSAPIDVSGCTSLPSVKVSGLPTGLKFTAKDILKKGSKTEVEYAANTIYGTPTKSGVFTVVATVTTAGKSTASCSQTVVVRKVGENVAKAEVALIDAIGTIASTETVPGKVTGMGVYARGKKVTLKATANKGYVFNGWYEAGEDPFAIDCNRRLSTAASYAFAMPANDVALTAAFVTTEADKASIDLTVNGMEFVDRSGETPRLQTIETNVYVGAYVEWPVAASALSATTVKVSGLPSGLKFTATPVVTKTTTGTGRDRVTVVVTNVPANTIYGTLTAASKQVKVKGEGEQWTLTPSQVKVTVTTAGKNAQQFTISFTVLPLPTTCVGTFAGYALVDVNTNAAAEVSSESDWISLPCPFTATVDAKGALSGSLTALGKKLSFKATGYASFDAAASNLAYGVAIPLKTIDKTWTENLDLALAVTPGEATLGDGGASPHLAVTAIDARRNATKDTVYAALAKPYAGTYVATFDTPMPDGVTTGLVTVALTVSAKGGVTAAGTFVDATTFSASATLAIAADGSSAELLLPVAGKSFGSGGAILAFGFTKGEDGAIAVEPLDDGFGAPVSCAAKYVPKTAKAAASYAAYDLLGNAAYAYGKNAWVGAALKTDDLLSVSYLEGETPVDALYAFTQSKGAITGVGRTVNKAKLTFTLNAKTGLFTGKNGTTKVFGALYPASGADATVTGIGSAAFASGAAEPVALGVLSADAVE